MLGAVGERTPSPLPPHAVTTSAALISPNSRYRYFIVFSETSVGKKLLRFLTVRQEFPANAIVGTVAVSGD